MECASPTTCGGGGGGGTFDLPACVMTVGESSVLAGNGMCDTTSAALGPRVELEWLRSTSESDGCISPDELAASARFAVEERSPGSVAGFSIPFVPEARLPEVRSGFRNSVPKPLGRNGSERESTIEMGRQSARFREGASGSLGLRTRRSEWIG